VSLFGNEQQRGDGAVDRLAHAISQKISHELIRVVEQRLGSGDTLDSPLVILPPKTVTPRE